MFLLDLETKKKYKFKWAVTYKRKGKKYGSALHICIYALHYSARHKDKNGFDQKLFIVHGFGVSMCIKVERIAVFSVCSDNIHAHFDFTHAYIKIY